MFGGRGPCGAQLAGCSTTRGAASCRAGPAGARRGRSSWEVPRDELPRDRVPRDKVPGDKVPRDGPPRTCPRCEARPLQGYTQAGDHAGRKLHGWSHDLLRGPPEPGVDGRLETGSPGLSPESHRAPPRPPAEGGSVGISEPAVS